MNASILLDQGLAERRGQVGLAPAGQPEDEQGVGTIDEVAGAQPGQDASDP